jgi:predicted nucleic-acid-binding protein
MIALDTNMIVRLLVEDDAAQLRRTVHFVETHCSVENPGFINRVTLCETVWVLKTGYGYNRAEIAAVIDRIVETAHFTVEDREQVHAALDAFKNGAIDFADAFVAAVNRAKGCEATATFDKKAARLDGFAPVR